MLKRCPVSMATGLYMSHIISTLSPGITIFESRSSVPSGQWREAASSVAESNFVSAIVQKIKYIRRLKVMGNGWL
jgi:hypothetical protein